MASKTAVAAILAYLHELYPNRDIGPATGEAWQMTFANWTDDELRQCAIAAATESGRTFFPTPGEIAAHRSSGGATVVDAEALLRRIEKLSIYNPHRGMIPPRVEQVRETLGDVIADAYATAGAARCFADDPVTRSIACREFQKAAEGYANAPSDRKQLTGPATTVHKFAPRNAPAESIGAVVSRALSSGVPSNTATA